MSAGILARMLNNLHKKVGKTDADIFNLTNDAAGVTLVSGFLLKDRFGQQMCVEKFKKERNSDENKENNFRVEREATICSTENWANPV